MKGEDGIPRSDWTSTYTYCMYRDYGHSQSRGLGSAMRLCLDIYNFGKVLDRDVFQRDVSIFRHRSAIFTNIKCTVHITYSMYVLYLVFMHHAEFSVVNIFNTSIRVAIYTALGLTPFLGGYTCG